MYDTALVVDVLRQIHRSAQTIIKRFEPIESAEDFLGSDEGMEKLDAICMQLIAIGESVKNLDKLSEGTLLPDYPGIAWKKVMGMRDVLTHHYFDLDAELVFSVCTGHIPDLANTTEQMIEDLERPCDSRNSSGA